MGINNLVDDVIRTREPCFKYDRLIFWSDARGPKEFRIAYDPKRYSDTLPDSSVIIGSRKYVGDKAILMDMLECDPKLPYHIDDVFYDGNGKSYAQGNLRTPVLIVDKEYTAETFRPILLEALMKRVSRMYDVLGPKAIKRTRDYDLLHKILAGTYPSVQAFTFKKGMVDLLRKGLFSKRLYGKYRAVESKKSANL